MTRIDIERGELREFSASIAAEAARSLELLNAIESTLAWLTRLTARFEADSTFAESLTAELGNIEGVIDPDDSLEEALLAAQQTVEQLYLALIDKRQAGREDPELTEEDGIESAYTTAIASAADLHNALNTLRWNVGEHDIDATEHEIADANLIDNADDLRASLRALRTGK